MDQSELFGRVIKVAAAKPQKENNEGLGSKVAVWEQVSDGTWITMMSWPFLGAMSDHYLNGIIGRMAYQACCERGG